MFYKRKQSNNNDGKELVHHTSRRKNEKSMVTFVLALLILVLGLSFSAIIFMAYEFNELQKQTNKENAKLKHEVELLRENIAGEQTEANEESQEMPFPVKVSSLTIDTEPETPPNAKIPVYIKTYNSTYSCEDTFKESINTADDFLYEQVEKKKACEEQSTKEANNLMTSCKSQCLTDCTQQVSQNDYPNCFSSCASECLSGLEYSLKTGSISSCDYFNTNTSELSSLVAKYCVK